MNKGITLITLIITCIVIMILVGATTIVGFDIVEKAEQQETNKQLAAVGNAVLEQYTKYIKTKDTTYLIGTKYKKTDSYIQETINKVGIELVQIPSNYAEDLVSYYQLSTLQLKQMGIEDSKYTYIVNYLTGEVINQTKALAGEKYYMYSRSYFDGNITDVQEVVGDKIRIAITPTTWTSTNVTVYLSYVGEIPTGYVIQYKKGNETWTTGNKLTVETNNTTVYARLYKSDSNDEMGITSKTITNIDKTAPTAPTGIESSATTNSITVQASGGTDGESGIAGYQYSIDNLNWSKTISEHVKYTFEDLSPEVSYIIYARSMNNAGVLSDDYYVKQNISLIQKEDVPPPTWVSCAHIYDGTPKFVTVFTESDGAQTFIYKNEKDEIVEFPTDAGTYTVYLTIEETEKYKEYTGMATMIIRPAIVFFSCPTSAYQYTGSPIYPEIIGVVAGTESELEKSNYQVYYRNRYGVVTEPIEPESYEIWVKFVNKNYIHPTGETDKQIWSFSISQPPPFPV